MNAVTLSLLVLYNNNGATKHELVLLDFIPQLPQHRPLWDRSNAETIKQAIQPGTLSTLALSVCFM